MIPILPHLSARPMEDWLVGMTSASYALGVILAIPFFSFLSDRFHRRKPFLCGALVQILAILIFGFSSQASFILLGRFVQGVAAASTWTIGLALVAESFSRNRARMMGYAMLASTLGMVLGPVIGGFLCDWRGRTFSFLIVAGLGVFDFAVRWTFVRELPHKSATSSELRKLLWDPSVLMACAIVVLAAWCWSVLEALLPNHLEHSVHITTTQVGTLFTLSSIVYGFCCPMVGALTDRYGSTLMMTIGLVVMALFLPLIALPTGVVSVGFLLVLISIGYGFAMDPALSALGAAVERHGSSCYALIYGVYNIAYSIGMVGSDVAAGVLSSLFSFKIALRAIAILMLFCLLLFKLNRGKGRPTDPFVST